MSSEPVVRVSNLSKCYHIYEQPSDRLRQFVFPRLQRLTGRMPKQYFREFWALRDISFEIRKGETVAIIGRNGSGKSTLLQIICGTLAATGGSAQANGKVAALLELGSGFNPDFTGRENVYLNGALLGFSNREIDEVYDQIADFAAIGEFIEQPVKTYSSGMVVRLAFAVQACVNPDILVVDEALAVGDIGFQYKCFRRIEELKSRGVTVLMVTHSTGSVLDYADRCIVLESGKMLTDTRDVLSAVLTYEKGMLPGLGNKRHGDATSVELVRFTREDLANIQREVSAASCAEKRFGSARAIIESVIVLHPDGVTFADRPLIKAAQDVVFRFNILSSEDIPEVALGISISKPQGGDVWGDNNLCASHPITLRPGRQEIEYSAKLPISSGEYLLHCGLSCLHGGEREELDQRRPVMNMKFWSPREQVGVVFAPIKVCGD